jgi:hypothetical protein
MTTHAPLWFNLIAVIIPTLTSMWLFLQGCVNIKTGRVTNFGLDAFFYYLDTKYQKFTKTKNTRWEDAWRMRLTGAMAIIMAISIAGGTAMSFYQFLM